MRLVGHSPLHRAGSPQSSLCTFNFHPTSAFLGAIVRCRCGIFRDGSSCCQRVKQRVDQGIRCFTSPVFSSCFLQDEESVWPLQELLDFSTNHVTPPLCVVIPRISQSPWPVVGVTETCSGQGGASQKRCLEPLQVHQQESCIYALPAPSSSSPLPFSPSHFWAVLQKRSECFILIST